MLKVVHYKRSLCKYNTVFKIIKSLEPIVSIAFNNKLLKRLSSKNFKDRNMFWYKKIYVKRHEVAFIRRDLNVAHIIDKVNSEDMIDIIDKSILDYGDIYLLIKAKNKEIAEKRMQNMLKNIDEVYTKLNIEIDYIDGDSI